MTSKTVSDLEHRSERSRYIIGLALAILLTLVAFASVAVFPGRSTVIVVSVLALCQIVAHFYYFLHIDPTKSHRDDLLLVLFTGLIASLMVGGTVWILWNQWSRMAG